MTDAEIHALAAETIKDCQMVAYGAVVHASAPEWREGDFGTWAEWQAVIAGAVRKALGRGAA